LGDTLIYVCQTFVDLRTNTLLTGYTCKTGYTLFTYSVGVGGCVSCANMKDKKTNADSVDGYVSCS